MRNGLRNYLILWVATLILAFLELRFFHRNVSVDFWMATTSIPALDGGSISVTNWTSIPLSEIWYYLILSIAGGITLAKVLTIIAQSAIAHNWKRATVWLGGLLCFAFSAYFISLLAYPVGAWRNVGLVVFYGTRGPFGPTLVFATAIIAAKLLSNAAQSNRGKTQLFLTLSGLAFTSVLTTFVIPIVAPMRYMESHHPSNTFITLAILDGLMYVALALIMVFALVKLAVVTVRRSRTAGGEGPGIGSERPVA
jgi:hypothetical protein